jgi:hypothetical protein
MSAGDKRRMEQEALKITSGSLKGFLFCAPTRDLFPSVIVSYILHGRHNNQTRNDHGKDGDYQ